MEVADGCLRIQMERMFEITGSYAGLLNSMFMCCLCDDILESPIKGICGHRFCSPCIRPMLDQQLNHTDIVCPGCTKGGTQSEIFKFEVYSDTGIMADLNHIEVKCKVCLWTGTLSLFKRHFRERHLEAASRYVGVLHGIRGQFGELHNDQLALDLKRSKVRGYGEMRVTSGAKKSYGMEQLDTILSSVDPEKKRKFRIENVARTREKCEYCKQFIGDHLFICSRPGKAEKFRGDISRYFKMHLTSRSSPDVKLHEYRRIGFYFSAVETNRTTTADCFMNDLNSALSNIKELFGVVKELMLLVARYLCLMSIEVETLDTRAGPGVISPRNQSIGGLWNGVESVVSADTGLGSSVAPSGSTASYQRTILPESESDAIPNRTSHGQSNTASQLLGYTGEVFAIRDIPQKPKTTQKNNSPLVNDGRDGAYDKSMLIRVLGARQDEDRVMISRSDGDIQAKEHGRRQADRRESTDYSKLFYAKKAFRVNLSKANLRDSSSSKGSKTSSECFPYGTEDKGDHEEDIE